jgi:UPF0755 protein
VKRFIGWSFAMLLVVVATLAVLGWIWVHDRPSDDPAVVAFVVPSGASGEEIAASLEAAGLTAHPFVLRLVMRFDGVQAQAGTYAIPRNADALELATLLSTRPASVGRRLTLIPGESVWEAAARIEAAGFGTRDAVLRHVGDFAHARGVLHLPVAARTPRGDGVQHTYLEGFLYPETHYLDPAAGVPAVLARVTGQFKIVWQALAAERSAARDRFGLRDMDLVTLASLVEEETRVASEGRRIAGVFYNRLARGMRLQTDPTLMYRPDRVAQEPTKAHRQDRTNPYSTYARDGLPPGPICSPGENALRAAVDPEDHDLIYFVAMRDGTGRHAFAKTFDAHRANIARFLKD